MPSNTSSLNCFNNVGHRKFKKMNFFGRLVEIRNKLNKILFYCLLKVNS
jgi:hypothetical protein